MSKLVVDASGDVDGAIFAVVEKSSWIYGPTVVEDDGSCNSIGLASPGVVDSPMPKLVLGISVDDDTVDDAATVVVIGSVVDPWPAVEDDDTIVVDAAGSLVVSSVGLTCGADVVYDRSRAGVDDAGIVVVIAAGSPVVSSDSSVVELATTTCGLTCGADVVDDLSLATVDDADSVVVDVAGWLVVDPANVEVSGHISKLVVDAASVVV
jgi:hypothetical protein